VLDQSGQWNYRGDHRSASDEPGRMALTGGIFDQPRVTRSKAAHAAVTETYLQFPGNQDDILAPWRRMPVDKRPPRLLRKNDMLCSLWPSQHRMVGQSLLFQMRLAIGTGVHSENSHGRRFSMNQHAPVSKIPARCRESAIW
jgi:hypothetical protein